MKNRIEFNVGQEVTFDSYGTPLKATVKSITRKDVWGDDTGRVWYELLGLEIMSTTTGGSIMESRYFHPWSKQRAATFFRV